VLLCLQAGELLAVQSYHQVISTDEDTVLRPIVNITNSISGIVDKVQALLMYWEKKYKHVWEQDKEAYIRYKYVFQSYPSTCVYRKPRSTNVKTSMKHGSTWLTCVGRSVTWGGRVHACTLKTNV
jgi:hypothetical protein